jgi:hypothetical protein
LLQLKNLDIGAISVVELTYRFGFAPLPHNKLIA